MILDPLELELQVIALMPDISADDLNPTSTNSENVLSC